jgi:predicted HTH transcriptional regulator
VTFRKAPTPKKVVHTGATLWSEEPGSTTGIRTAQEQLEQRFTLIMQYVREHEQITNREYRQLADVSESTALRDLETLVERGSLQRVGKRRGRHYRLP